MRVVVSENDRAYETAKWAYREHRYADALALLDRAGVQDEGRFVYARARCLMKVGRNAEALAACARLTREFNDPRGERIAEKIRASVAATPPPPPVEPLAVPTRTHRRLWLTVASLALLGAAAGVAAYGYMGHRETAPVATALAPDTPAKPPVTHLPPPEKPTPPAPPRAKDQLRLNGIERFLDRDRGTEERDEDVAAEPAGLQLASYVSQNREGRHATHAIFDGPNEVLPFTQLAAGGPAPVAPPDMTPHLVSSILELQTFKTEQRLSNARGDSVCLTNLNPYVNAWYLLDVSIGGLQNTLHVEVPALRGDPMKRPKLSLYPDGLVFSVEGKEPLAHSLWAAASEGPEPATPGGLNSQPVMPDVFKPDHVFTSAYNVICDGMLIVRSQKVGVATRLESATDLLRETRVGDWFVEKAKPYLIPEPEMGDDGHGTATAQAHTETYPLDARVDEGQLTLFGSPQNLGIETDAPDKRLYYGRWYKAVKHPHVFVSMMKPTLADKPILESYPDRVGAIGSRDRKRREAEALVYLVAYDLRYFRFGYALGADHPKLDWSPRATRSGTAPGPDGFSSRKPLCTIGAIPPYYSPYIAATFTGGFKREHSAFKDGPFSRVNSGSHFGFMQAGTVFSTFKPGLATIVIGLDGSFNMVTWPNEMPAWFTKLAHARQNCVPLIEGRDANGMSMPGTLVNDWGAGSWSGDQAGDFVTLRGSAAMQEFKDSQDHGNRFLIFAYFTGATPNAMARTFQAYRCSYAMLLDMNTPNYCFTALYTHDAEGKVDGVEYLHKEMAANNGQIGDLKFLQRNDTRDFFYALRIPERP